MKTVHIKQKLEDIGAPLSGIALGDFDYIGEFTAKKSRVQDNPLYKSTGAFFRPNYERGILIYSLIMKYKLTSFLEIGFGRGYSALCAAKAFHDLGNDGKVLTIDVQFDQRQMQVIEQTMPKEWIKKITIVQGSSQEMLSSVFEQHPTFDFIYIDGDHRAPAVKADWELVKDHWTSFCLFDDYHLPTKKEADIECAGVIDAIEHPNKELIIMDRRIFLDDRGFGDDQIDYGQVLLTGKLPQILNEW
jgi:hypothetical protein